MYLNNLFQLRDAEEFIRKCTPKRVQEEETNIPTNIQFIYTGLKAEKVFTNKTKFSKSKYAFQTFE